MARLTEERLQDLVKLMRNARIEMQGAHESLQYAQILEDGQTINCGSAIGSFNLTKEQLIEAASLEYERKRNAHDEFKTALDNICDSFGVDE